LFSQKLAGVGNTGKSGLSGVGYTGESGLTGISYIGESRHPVVAYTGESLIQPSRPANALKGTIPQNQTVSVKHWLLGRNSCVDKFSDLTHSDRCSLPRRVDLKYKELKEISKKITIIL
jgi:hypothetical protein